MNLRFLTLALSVAVLLLGYFAIFWDGQSSRFSFDNKDLLRSKFEVLASSGNSSCSANFTDSIDSMREGTRLQGSCCSLMSWHRYEEQVNGLTRYKKIKEIPADPYDIDAELAKEMKSHYEDRLNTEQQKAYDFAMANSDEKGPCCCKCWRWYVYGGLAKYLIQNYDFTGEQIIEVCL